MTDAVTVDGVTKRFGDLVAVDALSFRVAPGELFGFIGPDGAGKTTLFRMLVTLLVPDAGTATVLGEDVVRGMWNLRRRIGYMPGRFSLYPDLSVRENLDFFASVFGTTLDAERHRIAPIYSQIEPFRDRAAGALSGGMKQKLALCCALVHRPEILFLDEPTTGVDAVSRREFWDLLDEMKGDALTIVVSTPYMDEASRCDRVALVQAGRMLALDTPEAITRSFDRTLVGVRTADRYRALQVIRRRPQLLAYPFGETIHVTAPRGADASSLATELHRALSDAGIADVAVSAAEPTIEDLFIARMTESAATGAAA